MRPLVIDLFCGLGGWSEAFIDEGYRAVGFDIVAHDYGSGGYPGELVLRDARSISGTDLVKQYGVPACIVASPPCQEFSYMAMPWSKAKEKMRKILADPQEQARLTDLFNQCFRIQCEVSQAAHQYVPIIIENVRGAQRWVGKARWNFGSFYLWGDVPALMPIPGKIAKVPNFRFDGNGKSFQTASVERCEGVKAGDRNIGTNGERSNSFADTLREGYKTAGMNWSDRTEAVMPGRKGAGAGAEWFDKNLCNLSSKSKSRKAASAEIAKIPPALAQWIARCFKPTRP